MDNAGNDLGSYTRWLTVFCSFRFGQGGVDFVTEELWWNPEPTTPWHNVPHLP